MQAPVSNIQIVTTSLTPQTGQRTKGVKPYSAPMLIHYGSMQAITASGAGSKKEGGGPNGGADRRP